MAIGRKTNDKSAARLTWRQAMAWRMERHHLTRRASRKSMLDVVARIGGLHAQLFSSAELSLWARVDKLEPAAVGQALWEDRSLIKTWAMRGTLHLLPARELTLWHAIFNSDPRYRKPFWLHNFGVTDEDVERLVAGVAEALDGPILTREQLVAEVTRIIGSEELGGKLRLGWGTMLKPAAFQGRLCFAPNLGQKVRFTRPDHWLKEWSLVETAAAFREVTRRFFAAYAPATRDDYSRWLGVASARARALIEDLGGEVAQVEVQGTPAWMLAADVPKAKTSEPSRSVRLLPAFDQYVVAASLHARSLLPGDYKPAIYRPQGWISPVLLIDGRMEGVWRHEKKRGLVEVRIEPFGKLSVWARRAAEEEAERMAVFLGGKLSFKISSSMSR